MGKRRPRPLVAPVFGRQRTRGSRTAWTTPTFGRRGCCYDELHGKSDSGRRGEPGRAPGSAGLRPEPVLAEWRVIEDEREDDARSLHPWPYGDSRPIDG